MDKRRIEALERKIRAKTGKNKYPSPGFFKGTADVENEINEWRAGLLAAGYTIEAVNMTPAYIDNIGV